MSKFKLTLDNYYSPDRPHVSNSMMNDYLKSRAYYADKYLNKNPDYEFKVTDPMKVGLIADNILTRGEDEYQVKVLKRDNPDLYEEQKQMDPRYLVTDTVMDKALQVAEYVAKQPFWYTNVDDAYFQIPLEGEVEGLQVCGLPDRIDPLGETHYHLTDLKVVSAMKNSSPKKWFWNAQEMGYLRQLALYQYLWAQKQGVPVTNIMCSHSTASYIQPGITRVALFRVPQAVLDIAMEEVREIARNIKDENFDDKLVTWNQAQKIGYENDNKEQDLSDWDAVEDAGGNERFIKS
jgi:hypothetical protein